MTMPATDNELEILVLHVHALRRRCAEIDAELGVEAGDKYRLHLAGLLLAR